MECNKNLNGISKNILLFKIVLLNPANTQSAVPYDGGGTRAQNRKYFIDMNWVLRLYPQLRRDKNLGKNPSTWKYVWRRNSQQILTAGFCIRIALYH